MDDFSSLVTDFGFRPQGKAAPMSQSRASTSFGSVGVDLRSRSSSPFRDNRGPSFDDVYGSPPKYSSAKNRLPSVKSKSTSSGVSYNEIENVFASVSNENQNQDHNAAFDYLLGNLGRNIKLQLKIEEMSRGFDDLLPGFGASSPSRSSSRELLKH